MMFALNEIVNELEKPANLSLVLATVWVIVQKYASLSRSPLLIGQYATTKTNRIEHKNIIESVLTYTSDVANIKYLIEGDGRYDNSRKLNEFGEGLNNEELFFFINGKKDKAIWFLDSLAAFGELESYILNVRNYFHRNGIYCIIYTGREPDRLDNIRIIFQRLFKIHMIDVNVFITIGNVAYVYTYFPFTQSRCYNTQPEFYLSFRDITTPNKFKLRKPRFFPKKLNNLWGCKLRVTTWNAPPFIIIEKDNNTGDLLRLHGIEGMLISLLAERMNFSVRILEQESYDRGYNYGNGTVTGAMKMLVDGETDIFVIYLHYDKRRVEVIQPVLSYLSDPIVMAIPKGHRMTPFDRLWRPFRHIIWLFLSLSILTGTLVIFGIKLLFPVHIRNFVFGQGSRIPFTNLWNTLYGGSIYGNLPRGNFARFLLMLWILYTFVLRSAYLNQLFLNLKDGRVRYNLKTVDEVIQQRYTIFTYPTVLNIISEATTEPVNFRFVDSNKHSLSKLLQRLSNGDTNIAVTTLSAMIRHFNQRPENRNRPINYLEEPLLMSPITFYLRKHSYLEYETNEILLAIMSAGLIRRFENYYLDRFKDKQVQEPAGLTLLLLFGLFSVYLILLLLCGLVFVLELLSRYCAWTKRMLDFFNY